MDAREEIKLKITSSIDKMPSLPTTVGKIIQLAHDLNSSAKDILAVIQMDPVVAAKVLKLINSAYYGMSTKVSLRQAVVLLGINTIKNLALSSAIVGQVGKGAIKIRSFDQQRYWEHCLGTAITAKDICKKMGTDPATMDEFFVAGLVHDIGKMVMALFLPMYFAKAIQYGQENKLAGSDAELAMMGIDHAEVGSLLAEKWGLNQLLVDAIRYHHRPTEKEGPLTWVVHIANYFVSVQGYENTGEFAGAKVEDAAFAAIGLKQELLQQSFGNLPEEIEKATVFLQT